MADEKKIKLWRYIPLESLVDILENKRLLLTPGIYFEDPWEGFFPLGQVKKQLKRLYGESYDEKHNDFPCIMRECWRRSYQISCWHSNNYESVAMWKIYAPQNRGVALLTTLELLKGEIRTSARIEKIKYVDSVTDEKPALNPANMFCFKLKSFAFEKEWRVLKTGENLREDIEASTTTLSTSILKPVKNVAVSIWPPELIQKIVVSPLSNEMFREAVRAILKKYNFPLDRLMLSKLFVPPNEIKYEGPREN